MLSIDTKKALAAVLESLNKASSDVPVFVPVTDSIYIRRLEKALTKNFDYIRRKDSGLTSTLQKKSDATATVGGKQSNGHGYPKENSFSNVRPGNSGSDGNASTEHFHKTCELLSYQRAGSSATVNIQAQVQTQIMESLSIYISGLPLDIDEKDLGSIKKVKIYVNPDGTKKGDALVTYTRAEAAAMAVVQYNNLNIGEGCIISVCRASFTPAATKKEEPDQAQESEPSAAQSASYTETVYYSSDSAPNKLRDALPPECLAASYPVALLSKVYDPADVDSLSDPNFFSDLEADMLAECCKFGKIICLLSPEGPVFDSLGCIAVTFESMAAARECASSLHGRWFDSRQIETRVFSPPEISPFTAYSSSQVQIGVEGRAGIAPADRSAAPVSSGKGGNGSSAVLSYDNEKASQNSGSNNSTLDIENKIDCPEVDDFLNSFL